VRRGGNADIVGRLGVRDGDDGASQTGISGNRRSDPGSRDLRRQGETSGTWRLHGTLEGDARPLLCKDPETANLVVKVLGRAIQARAGGDVDKAKRLFEVAAKLESEICLKPATDDIVILRCNLGDKNFGETRISLAKISALMKSNSSAGEQPFYAWAYATIEPAADGSTAQDADKKWCAEETAADAPLEPTPDLIQRVQQRFYDFGFGIKQIDGRLSNETVQGLIAFQKWAGLPETGQLTKLTLQKIDATEAPPGWAALVFDGLGNHSMSTATRAAPPKPTPSAPFARNGAAISTWPRSRRRIASPSLRRVTRLAPHLHPGLHQHGRHG
jgi:Putative peptidoglycan binding domain